MTNKNDEKTLKYSLNRLKELKKQCEAEREKYNALSDDDKKGKSEEDKETFKRIEVEIKKGIANLEKATGDGSVSGKNKHNTLVNDIEKRYSNVLGKLKRKSKSTPKSRSNSSSDVKPLSIDFIDYGVRRILNGTKFEFRAKIVDSNKKTIPVMETIDIEIREGRKVIKKGHSTTNTLGIINYKIPDEFRGKTIIIDANYKGIKGKYEGSGISTLPYKIPLESNGKTGPLIGEVSEPRTKTNEKDLNWSKQRIGGVRQEPQNKKENEKRYSEIVERLRKGERNFEEKDIDCLGDALEDKDINICIDAALTLGEMAENKVLGIERAIDPVCRALDNKEIYVRLHAIKTIKTMVENKVSGIERVIDPVCRALGDKDLFVCIDAIEIIEIMIENKVSGIERVIDPLCKTIRSTKRKLSEKAEELLEIIANNNMGWIERAIDLVCQALGDKEAFVRVNASRLMLVMAENKVSGIERAIDPVCRLLEDKSLELRDLGKNAINIIEIMIENKVSGIERAIDPLCGVFSSKYGFMNATAIRLIGIMAENKVSGIERAIDPACKVLGDEDIFIRINANKLIKIMAENKVSGIERAIDPLYEALKYEYIEKVYMFIVLAMKEILKNIPKDESDKYYAELNKMNDIWKYEKNPSEKQKKKWYDRSNQKKEDKGRDRKEYNKKRAEEAYQKWFEDIINDFRKKDNPPPPPQEFIDHYKTLGVKKGDDSKKIKDTYRERVMKLHSDRRSEKPLIDEVKTGLGETSDTNLEIPKIKEYLNKKYPDQVEEKLNEIKEYFDSQEEYKKVSEAYAEIETQERADGTWTGGQPAFFREEDIGKADISNPLHVESLMRTAIILPDIKTSKEQKNRSEKAIKQLNKVDKSLYKEIYNYLKDSIAKPLKPSLEKMNEKQRILEQKAIIEQRVNELLLDLREVVNQ